MGRQRVYIGGNIYACGNIGDDGVLHGILRSLTTGGLLLRKHLSTRWEESFRGECRWPDRRIGFSEELCRAQNRVYCFLDNAAAARQAAE